MRDAIPRSRPIPQVPPVNAGGSRRDTVDNNPGTGLAARDGVCPFFENSTVCRVFVCASFVLVFAGIAALLGLVPTLVVVGEFDPGSGRTLAACLTHASRTGSSLSGGGLVANG